jgi:hypothetical protein
MRIAKMFVRLLRSAAVALGFAALFTLSRQATLARGGEDLPGISWALGVVSLIFLVSALTMERMRGGEANLQKDLLWGLGVGGILAIIARLA